MVAGRPPSEKTKTVEELMDLRVLLVRIQDVLPKIEQAVSLAEYKVREITGRIEGIEER